MISPVLLCLYDIAMTFECADDDGRNTNAPNGTFDLPRNTSVSSLDVNSTCQKGLCCFSYESVNK